MLSLRIEAPPALEAAAVQWFRDGRLDFEGSLALRIEVAAVSAPVRPDPPANQADGATIWVATPEQDRLDIWWETHRSALSITPAGAGLRLAPEVAADLEGHAQWALVTPAALLLRSTGRFHIHAASARAPSGRGWMMVGDSGSGKSTTTGLLAARGWAVSTDDVAFLERTASGAAAVRGFRSRVALRPGGAALLEARGGEDLGRRGKRGFWPEEIGGRWEALIEPDVIVFTEIGGARTEFEPVGKGAALTGLFRRSFWPLLDAGGADEYLGLLRDLAGRAQCYRVRLAPDLFEAPGALEDFLPAPVTSGGS